MTKETESAPEKATGGAAIPWLMAAAVFLVYLFTLNHWITFGSLPYVARLLKLNWMPELTAGSGTLGPFGPAYFVFTYPTRFLPAKLAPLALNLISLICGIVTIWLLARSVQLLPHDRTHEQRQRERGPLWLLSLPIAWIPPVVAATLFGLQRSTWEDSTSASATMFDLMLLAYAAWCLLEFRVSQKNSWLYQGMAVYAVGITDSFIMLALFPVFCIGLVWMRGLGFFSWRFLRWLLLCLLVPMLLYLVLPVVFAFRGGGGGLTFLQALKVNLLSEKNAVAMLFRLPNHLALLLVCTSLVPLLVMSVRWASHFGDPSKVGTALTTATLHVAHAALLGLGVWVSFDPVFSPNRIGVGFPQLDYIRVLSVGYLLGYFLLVFRPLPVRMGRVPPWFGFLDKVCVAGVWVLLFVAPVGLFLKNLPFVRMTNGPALSHYANALTRTIPHNAVVLCDSDTVRSDFPTKLWLSQLWLARDHKDSDYIFLDTMAMQFPPYLAMLQRRYGTLWPNITIPNTVKRVPDQVVLGIISKLAQEHSFYYLHPSFGYYFEFFYPRVHGLALEMKPYPTNSISSEPITAVEVGENSTFWKDEDPNLALLEPWVQSTSTNRNLSLVNLIKRRFYIRFEPNPTAVVLARYYSMARNFWGVQLQRSGHLVEARGEFEKALELNPDNIPARANLDCNTAIREGRPVVVPPLNELLADFSKYRDWQQIIRDNGPFDDAAHCFAQGYVYAQARLFREATIQFERVRELQPDNALAHYWLARFYSTRLPQKSLQLISDMRQDFQRFADAGVREQDVATVEAVALFETRQVEAAERVLQKTMEEHPTDEVLLRAIVQISGSFGRLTNAIAAIEQEVSVNPTNVSALVVAGYLHMQVGEYAAAIPLFDRVIKLEPNNYTARFDRAICYLRAGEFENAEKEYSLLHRAFPTSFRIDYGLAEIAWQRKDTNAAIANYQRYLTNAPPDTDEARLVNDRLQMLRRGRP